MASILVLAAGALGLLTALISLALGAGLFTALLIWSATGLAATLIGLALALLPRHETAPQRA